MLFGFLTAVSFILVMIITAVLVTLAARLTLGHPLAAHEYSKLIIQIVSRLLSGLFFIVVLFRLRRLKSAGFRLPVSARHWLIIILPTVYLSVAASYAFTRTLTVDWSDPVLLILNVLLAFSVGFVEETVYRGAILHTLIRGWGNGRQAIMKAVLISSLLFSIIHLLNLLNGEPLTLTLSQFVYATLLGITFAAIVLTTQSIWPAIVFHWLIDAAVYLNLIGKPDPEPTIRLAVLLIIIIVPLGVYGLYLLSSSRIEQI